MEEILPIGKIGIAIPVTWISQTSQSKIPGGREEAT
jgi:hypothetical protein